MTLLSILGNFVSLLSREFRVVAFNSRDSKSIYCRDVTQTLSTVFDGKIGDFTTNDVASSRLDTDIDKR